MRPPKVWVHALVIFLLGFGLRIWNMAKEPPGYEEMAATLVAARGAVQYLGVTPPDFDFAPPVYFALLRPVSWVGLELWRLRLLSVLAGSAAGVLLVVAGRRLLGGRTATLAGYLLAIHPLHIFFSQEIQPLALFSLASLVAFQYLVRSAESNRSRHWILFDVSAILLLHMLREAVYLVACFLLVHLARALFFPLTDDQRKLRRGKLLQAIGYNYAAIIVAALPWLIIMPRGVRWDVQTPTFLDLLQVPLRFWVSGMASWPSVAVTVLPVILLLALLPPAIKAAREISFRSFAVLACLVGAVLLPFANSLHDKPRFDPAREAAVALPFLAISIGALIARCNLIVRGVLILLFATTFLLAAIQQSWTTHKPPLRDIMQALTNRARGSDIVAFWPDYGTTIGHYLNAVHGTTYQVETAEDVLTQWAEVPEKKPIYFTIAHFPEHNPLMYTFRGALSQHARAEVVWSNPLGYDAVIRTRNLDRPALKSWFLNPSSLEIMDSPSSATFFLFKPNDPVFRDAQFHQEWLEASYDRGGRRVVWTAASKVDLQLPVMLQRGSYVLRLHASPEFDPPVALAQKGFARSGLRDRSVELTLRAYEQRRVKLEREQVISINFQVDVEVRQLPVHIEVSSPVQIKRPKSAQFGLKIYSIAIDQAPETSARAR